MRKKVIVLFFMLTSVMFVFAETVTIVADIWSPINGDPGYESPGYVVELAEIIFKEAGYDFQYKVIPWARAIQSVGTGEYSAVIGATSDNSEELNIPEMPFGILENDFYTVKNSNWVYSGPSSMEGQKLGTILGYAYGDIQPFIERNKGTNTVQESYGNEALEKNFKKLLADRITVLVEWGPVADYMAFTNGWTNEIRHAGKGGNTLPLFLGFDPKRGDLAQVCKNKLEDGTVDKILGKYGLNRSTIGL